MNATAEAALNQQHKCHKSKLGSHESNYAGSGFVQAISSHEIRHRDEFDLNDITIS